MKYRFLRTLSLLLTLALLTSTIAFAENIELTDVQDIMEIDESIVPDEILLEDSDNLDLELELQDTELEEVYVTVEDPEQQLDMESFGVEESSTTVNDAMASNSDDDFLISDDGMTLLKYRGNGGFVTIPFGIKYIGYRAFRGCDNVINVTIPGTVITIEEESFYQCVRLTNITIPNSVTSIGDMAFHDCENLTSVTIPDSVTSIGIGAFSWCESLTNVTIPNSVTSIGDGAFSDCTNLLSVTIPNSVTSIGKQAFDGCTSLTSVTIPDSVTSIGNMAFCLCNSLTSVTIPDNVTSIDYMTFYGCSSLTSVTIPNSVTSIGEGAFSHCTNLISVTIPNNMTEIDNDAFYECPNLTIYANGTSYAARYAYINEIKFSAIYSFPIKIGNNHETEGVFNEPIEHYILTTDSSKYNPDLAYMLMSLAAAAYNDNKQDGKSDYLTVENAGFQTESKELYHITKAYADLGFNDYQTFNYYNDPKNPEYGSDNAAFAIGCKEMGNGEVLALIAVRGSFGRIGDLTPDWVSNVKITVNNDGWHEGFYNATESVYSQVKYFLEKRYDDQFIESNIRFVITGHSRGAGIANLLAVTLNECGIPNSRIYDYNFACPDVARKLSLGDWKKGHENIFNICNSADAVGVIPGIIGNFAYTIVDSFKQAFSSWGKYGTTLFYYNDWSDPAEFDLTRTFNEGNSPHDYKHYIAAMAKKPTSFKSWAQIEAQRALLIPSHGYMIERIVEILYSKYASGEKPDAKANISKAKVTVKDQVYTGNALKPSVKVVLNKKTLKKGTDYTVAYQNNKAVGTAIVTIKGKGKYKGSKKATFNINPKAVALSKLTGGPKQLTVEWKKGKNITGYEIQYSLKKDFSSPTKVTIKKAATVNKVLNNLKAKKMYYVRIRTYKTVNNKKYYSAWSKAKNATTK